MFCDLVGSTALASRLDPEDLREVIGAYHKCVADTISRFDGFVAKYMGDGVLAYFGYPSAHEEDAERAVRASLGVIEAVRELPIPEALQVRIGLATGLAVVGDLIGSGAAQEQAVIGETPNLAARLQALAGPDQIVIPESTRRLIDNLFAYESLGEVDVKGLTAPVRAFRVLSESRIDSRFEALRTGETPLVGRDEEIELLSRCWGQAKVGRGQIVLILAEPGIGKSRLAEAFRRSLEGEPHVRLRYFCSPHHQDSALLPFIRQLERAAGFEREDTPLARLEKLQSLLAANEQAEGDVQLLAELLSVPLDDRYPALDLTPQRKKEMTFEAMLRQLAGLARQQPVLMIVEDLHWVDPSSRELLDLTVEDIARLPVLLLATFRPEFQPTWIGQPHVTSLSLRRLGRQESGELVRELVGNSAALPSELLDEIVERTDGVPLFLEELTKAVLESASSGVQVSAIPPTLLAVPATLHASLMARLDRLGPAAREIAQMGAAIGREFSYELLAATTQRTEEEWRDALGRLVEAGLVFQRGLPPQAIFSFKHALVRDAAYGTLLREPRRALHVRIAGAIEQQFPNIAEDRPELLAHHCTEAGLIEKAARLWGKAGQRSLARSALVEAEIQLRRALDQMATLRGTPALRREQIALQVDLLTVLMHVKGYGAAETKAATEHARLLIENAEALGEPQEDPLLLFSVLYSSWVGNIAAFDGDAAVELSGQFLALADKRGTNAPLMLAHRMVGMTLLSIGELADARRHLDRAIELYNPAEHRSLAARFGADARVAILEWRSRALWLLGYPEAALKDVDKSFRNAREIRQAATLMHALAHSTATLILCGNYVESSARARELIGLAKDKGSLYWKANGLMWDGCRSALTGRPSDAIETLTSALSDYRSTGATVYTPFVLSHLARSYAGLGQHKEAWRVIDEAITATAKTKEKWSEAEIHRTAGDLALMLPEANTAKAEVHFERAVVVARKQQAKTWELRSATSLARLWRDQGRRTEARDLLAPIYGWFTEGFDTPDLKEAKALLDELD